MTTPTQREENKLRRKGYKYIAGLDEVGKGAWAGPLVAAAVILPENFKIKGLRDSKQLSAIQRKLAYLEIVKQAVNWSVGIVSERIIDRIGIQPANIQAMEIALQKLTVEPDFLLIDYLKLSHLPIPFKSFKKGDERIVSVAAASIIAKVTRDFILTSEHKKFPAYGFDRHKGYGTDQHYQMICRNGICQIHRQSFLPMKEILKTRGNEKKTTKAKIRTFAP